jgi:2Fe-2S ferredoxin
MKVKFLPQNVEFEIKPGQSVMHVAQDHGIYIKSVCKGVPSCAECRVRILEGEHNVLPPASEELSLIGTGHFIDRRRLSCQLKCFGDISVDMNEQIAKESGLIVGRKKKLAIKDDRVEQAVVRRSEEPGDTEETSENGDPTATPVEGAEPRVEPRRESRGGGAGSGDRGPRNGNRGPRENRGGGGGQREARGPDQRPRGASPNQQPHEQQRPSRPGEPMQGQGGPQQAGTQGEGAGEPRGEGGGKRRRRRRGKGGGQGQGPGTGQGPAQGAGPSAPSRPNTQPPKS